MEALNGLALKPAGVEEQGMCTTGSPRNLGDPAFSV